MNIPVSAADGIDAATTLLYRAVVDSARHRRFIDSIQSLGREPVALSPPSDVRLVIAPGAFYRENPGSGADGRVVRAQAERMGWPIDTIPVASTGSLLDNARTICSWLGEQRGSRIILVSLSKGGADVKMALRQPGAAEAFGRVAYWINLCGILDGTPQVDWLLSGNVAAVLNRLYYRARGVRFDFLRGMRRGRGSDLDFELKLPAQLRLISIVGFPLRRHMTSGVGRRCFDRLAPFGPNDGVIILADVCAQPGLIYPIWGADHYLRSGTDIDRLVGTLLRFVAREP